MADDLLKHRPSKGKSKWQIDSREIIHRNPWYNYVHDKGRTDHGRDYDYYYVQKDFSAGVICLDDGHMIMVNQYRYLTNRNSLEIPGGGSYEQTTPEELVKRELMEETGYEAGSLQKIGEFDVANGHSSDIAHIYLARQCKKTGKQDLDDTELGMKVVLIPVEEVYGMVQEGRITDSFTLAALFLAWPYLL